MKELLFVLAIVSLFFVAACASKEIIEKNVPLEEPVVDVIPPVLEEDDFTEDTELGKILVEEDEELEEIEDDEE